MTGGRKAFRGNTVLSGIDLAVDDGEFVAVLGRSGSGKTTLLRVLAGLETLDAGSLEWRESGGERPHTGVVFQRALLMPWLTVEENIRFGRRFAAHRASFENDYALGLLRRFGLDGLADRYPDQLSGGQAQRVAIIRAAAIRPRLLLLDEPFSALDPAVRGELRSWLAELAAELRITVVLVTHDVDEALELADRTVLLSETGRIGGEWRLESGLGRDDPDRRAEILTHFGHQVGQQV
ncbi:MULTISPECIES: ABC transporter ATP-binding protein [unclassified Gordonia (in: high G+C Gram-positive bacteria)]|uniref:ABC transporter ATP-binding protein n=1 Tax=unclassified Gordonia (in: high G+C Gram-positive bacteria) TaxID=2657482 RepID=UPI00201823A9|nr:MULTISPECIES: ABC transporter ATP-binding protein [unclassified Gordonia (in: high G+C Gram-positive bacteria)]